MKKKKQTKWWVAISATMLAGVVLSYQACSKQGFELSLKQAPYSIDPSSIGGLLFGEASAMASSTTEGAVLLDAGTFVIVGYPLQSGKILNIDNGKANQQAMSVYLDAEQSAGTMNSSIVETQIQTQAISQIDLSQPVIIIAKMDNQISNSRLYINGRPSDLTSQSLEDSYDLISRNFKISTQSFQLMDAVAYDHALTDDQIAGLTGYFAAKWKIPVSDLRTILSQQSGTVPSGVAVTYSTVQPILQNKCNACHGGDVTNAKSLSQIQKVITSGSMNNSPLPSQASMTPEQKSQVLSWIQAGGKK